MSDENNNQVWRSDTINVTDFETGVTGTKHVSEIDPTPDTASKREFPVLDIYLVDGVYSYTYIETADSKMQGGILDIAPPATFNELIAAVYADMKG